ncbi:histidine kinase [Nocardioides baekrokdamisoli]|uniref:histidine kinase n=1 Tax=Nocardioides baekrokdamisoli TaxID=1804624 RepID=A0A3G9J0Q7_9ACTN|nr:sensor histidine kinase [Nocardioides baekrokdamisoli]BBH17054.1 histidine kinase [Nocardioides baekrokdamisoli]
MRKLSTQILASQVVILVITVAVGFGLFVRGERTNLDHTYERRAGAIAATTAQIPDIRRCMAASARCGDTIQRLAIDVMNSTGASYVVVIDLHRIRHSHPYAALIGQPVSEPIATLDGQIHYTVDAGSTGRSANGKAPLYDLAGAMVGEVSVGLQESSVAATWRSELPLMGLWFGVALGVGALVSLVLAARLKRRTFGLELDEIALLFQEREAVLHGIREGMIALDEHQRVVVMNDEARRLADLGSVSLGERLKDALPEGRLRDVLTGATAGRDDVVLTDDFCLTVNRMPVSLAGRPHGSVITLRDRTELAGLLRELDSVRGMTDALRAQQHEFSNRMHTVAGLLELGEHQEALAYLTDLVGGEASRSESLRERIASPLVVALLLAKTTIASERGIDLVLTDDSWLGDVPTREQAVTTIVGNLIDNALDALSGDGFEPGRQGRVEVSIVEDPSEIRIRVRDNGPGLPPGAATAVFVDGYTTKPARESVHRGLGLALVHRIVQRLGGVITASEGPGAEFSVTLPKDAS